MKAYTPNDAGNAELFIDRHGDRLRYVHGLEKWLVFTNRWRKDDDGGVHRLAVELSKNLLHEAADIADTAVRDTAVRRALSLGRVKVISDMLNLAKCDARIIIRPSDIDADPWLLGAENGVINLRTGEVKAYNRQTYITKTLGVSYDPAAKCLRWLRFNEEIFEDKAVARYIWKAAGYTLSGMTTEKAFLFLYGKGNNGKTKFTETLFALFGDYAKRAADEIRQCSPNGREPEQAKAELAGTRFLCGSEVKQGSHLNEKVIKDISGGDTIRGRWLYRQAFAFPSTAKLWMYGNHKPVIRGTDSGIWGRVHLVPFLSA